MRTSDGGSTGPLGDPLAGLQMPPGDPGPLGTTANQLTSWANDLGTGGAGHRSAASAVVGSAWIGGAANQAGKTVSTIADAASSMADAADHASSVLHTCASNWSTAIAEWKRAQTLAAQALQEESAHRNAAATATSSMTGADRTANPTGYAQAQAAAGGSDGFLSPHRAEAVTLGQKAVDDAIQAINMGSTGLAEINGVVGTLGSAPSAAKDSFLNNLMDGVGKANSVIGAFATTTMARAGYSYATLPSALEKAFSAADDATVARLVQELGNGADPFEVAGQLWSHVAGENVAKSLFAAQEMKSLSSGGLNVLGDSGVAKWGIRGMGGLAIAGDVFTVLHPDEGGNWGKAEQASAVVNGVATGGGLALDAGEGGAALLAANSLDWVPVAGQVVAIGTGLFLAGDYLYTHEKWFKDGIDATGQGIANVATGAYHEAGHLLSDIGL
ncbi:MAG: hypothetical protein ACR2MN_02470 [Acidimicrobiales bacterium]